MYVPKLGLFLRTSLPLLAASALIACGNKDDGGGKDKEPETGTGGMDGGMGGEPNEPPDFVPTACDDDDDCDDSFYCNGEERCVDNLCRQGERVDCNDGVGCTIDRCVEDSRECESEAPDEDGDGHADASCDDADGNPLGDDCDDEDPLSYPGNAEVCDPENRDEDCNPATFGDLDSDQDGYIDAKCCNEDDGDLNCGDDCDDKKTNVNPAATEACDFLDNNCDGETDEGVSIEMYEDKDHDGRGDDEAGTVATCAGAVGFAAIAGDCDDDDPEVFEGQFEICDGKDNNCNDVADEVRELAPWYKDVDGDGYGDPESNPVLSCYRIPGRVLSQNDCDDAENTVNPNATEICDGKDNNCNGKADFKLPGNNNFEDDDEDGAADADCGGTDCNDTDARTSEGAEEVCDRIDNDCDGEVDEQTVQNIWYIDEDGDGWGVVIGSALASCDPLPARASQFGDCDDTDRDVKPGVAEVCDGIDQDCDGLIDEGAGVTCDLPNALSACRFGECAVFSCMPGFEDANNTPLDGCEEPIDPADYATETPCSYDITCNDGNLCNGIEVCADGFCRLGTPLGCGVGPSVIQGDFVVDDGRDVLELEGIDIITGNLTISGTSLTSLVGLESLRVIGGDLHITGNNNLVRLSGSALSDLEMVGGDIVIGGNPKLVSVALPSLVSTNSLSITSNSSLTAIDEGDFANLVSVERLLQIESNPNLVSVSGFDGIERIGGQTDYPYGYCDGQGGLEVQHNPLLATLDAFDPITEVGGDLCVSNNPLLPEISFPNLESVGMNADFSYLYLTSMDLPLLETVGEEFNVGGGEGGTGPISELSLPSLVEVGSTLSYASYGTSALETLAFPSLTMAGGIQIALSDAPELTTLDLSALEAAGSFLVQYDTSTVPTGMPILTFPALVDVAGNFSVYAYAEVTEVSAPLLESAGNINLTLGSDALEVIDFSALAATDGDVFVRNVPPGSGTLSLVDFSSLTQVATLGSYWSTATFQTPTSDLDIGLLNGVGSDYTGMIVLEVLPYDACADVSRIQSNGLFAGTIIGTFVCN